jgi:hypothetical protein
MPIQSPKNLYPGINAHLNSFLQSEDGGWESFHVEHLVQIAHALNRLIRPRYVAAPERSLQISQTSVFEEVRSRVRPSVTIFQRSAQPMVSGAALAPAEPFVSFSVEEVMPDPDDDLISVIIYEARQRPMGRKPVTRIELLSPANKPGHSYYRPYMAKRADTLRSGLALVELDYLHETRPLLARLPSYADGDTDAYPYLILVSDPRPEVKTTEAYGFGVDERMPILRVPLAGEEFTLLDFSAVYDRTFEDAALLQDEVDYAVEPVRMETYTPADQARIRQRMATIAAEHAGDAD